MKSRVIATTAVLVVASALLGPTGSAAAATGSILGATTMWSCLQTNGDLKVSRDGNYAYVLCDTRLYKVAISANTPKMVGAMAVNSGASLSLSPDGKWGYLLSPGALRVLDLRFYTPRLVRTVSYAVWQPLGGRDAYDAGISPNGRYLYVRLGSPYVGGRDGLVTLSLANPSNPVRTSFIKIGQGLQAGDTVVSPDGTRLITTYGGTWQGIRLYSLASPGAPRPVSALALPTRGLSPRVAFAPNSRTAVVLGSQIIGTNEVIRSTIVATYGGQVLRTNISNQYVNSVRATAMSIDGRTLFVSDPDSLDPYGLAMMNPLSGQFVGAFNGFFLPGRVAVSTGGVTRGRFYVLTRLRGEPSGQTYGRVHIVAGRGSV